MNKKKYKDSCEIMSHIKCIFIELKRFSNDCRNTQCEITNSIMLASSNVLNSSFHIFLHYFQLLKPTLLNLIIVLS